MRRYSLVFMEQRVGTLQLRPKQGGDATVSFAAEDDDAALSHVGEHHVEQLKACVRAELSSLLIVPSPTSRDGIRLVDDTHANPHFQDSYLRYNPATRSVEVDWDSTRTTLIADLPS